MAGIPKRLELSLKLDPFGAQFLFLLRRGHSLAKLKHEHLMKFSSPENLGLSLVWAKNAIHSTD